MRLKTVARLIARFLQQEVSSVGVVTALGGAGAIAGGVAAWPKLHEEFLLILIGAVVGAIGGYLASKAIKGRG